MQVLGDLIRLPTDGFSLPLPWWQRAPLGFLNGTNLYVGLVKSNRPVGDLVVSALDINKWDNMIRLECTHDDERGVIASLVEAVLPLNVALAETVTTEMGKGHRATLFCEEQGIRRVTDALPRLKETLKHRKFRDISLDPFLSPSRLRILKSCRAIIRHGWLRDVNFIEWIRANHEQSQQELVDLTQVVVSADTENRILRYVFPYKGAKTLKITHADRPGALHQIISELAACNLNMLSALLRRGGQQNGYAEFIAVCEPDPLHNPVEVYQQVRRRIEAMDQKYGAVLRISDGKTASKVIYLPAETDPGTQGQTPIFLGEYEGESRGTQHSSATDLARKCLTEHACSVLHAPRENHPEDSFGHIHPLMHRAAGAILVVTGLHNATLSKSAFDMSSTLAAFRAVGKPVVIVADGATSDVLTCWVRGNGITIARLPQEDIEPDHYYQFLRDLIGNWVRELRRYE